MIINIINRDFDFLGQLDEYESFIPTKKFSGVGGFELHLSSKNLYANVLLKENIIFTDEKKAYVILYRKRDTKEDKLEVRGLELKSYLQRMIIFPPVGKSNFRINDNAETIMKEYVSKQLERKSITNIEVATDKKQGEQMVYQSRYKNLADELGKISNVSGLGWDIHLDMKNKKFVFDTYLGRDVTVNQDTLPPAIFSPDFDNIEAQSLEESTLDYANTAIVAGQGEGVNRAIEIVGETDGLDSIETFVDARDIENDSDLSNRGYQKLKETEEILVFDSQVLTDKNLVYEKDFKLGDIATIQNKDWDITVGRRITELTEIYEASGFRLDVAFGENMPTIVEKMKMMTDEPVAENNVSEGEQGPEGEVGPQGVPGPKGEIGPKGARGLQGVEGDAGYTPEKGVDYFDGEKGDRGAQGIQGVKGDTGARGPQGLKGDTGARGLKGDQGDTGPRGIQGIQGEIGPIGKTGPKGEPFVYGDFTTTQLANLKGPKGDKGDRGPQGVKGDRPNHRWISQTQIQFENPDGSWSKAVDLDPQAVLVHQEVFNATANQDTFNLNKGAYRTSTNSIAWYLDGVKQSNDSLIEVNSKTIKIKGGVPESTVLIEYLEFANVAIGLKGETGPQGERGIQGVKGDTGEQGPQGIQGPKGPIGNTGNKGDPFVYSDFTPTQLSDLKGPKGDKGDIGLRGIQGPQGIKGDTGPKGDIGPRGLKGDKGDTGPQGPEGAAVADSVEWNKVLNKPSLYPPSTHSHNSLSVPDTRAVNEKPFEIPSRTLSTAFKQNTSVANPPVSTESAYAHILTMNGWTGAGAGGGGETTQLAFGDSLAIRMSKGANSWGAWKRLAYDDDIQKTITSRTEPPLSTGDQWHKEY